jgi:Clustered mitochondria
LAYDDEEAGERDNNFDANANVDDDDEHTSDSDYVMIEKERLNDLSRGGWMERQRAQKAFEKRCKMKSRIRLDAVADRDWTKEFQRVLQRPPLERGEALARLSHEFVSVARKIGEVIIREHALAYEDKTVRPVSEKLGQAGGVKYFSGGIFFKFCSADAYRIYGSDANALKSANLELVALNALASAGLMLGVNLPMTAIVDFAGHRLVAQSVLPIDDTTLVYGSSDMGRSVMRLLPKMNELMERLARVMYVKEHRVGAQQQAELHGPLDIEGHQGADKMLYLCDVARYFPPEAPDVFPRPSPPGAQRDQPTGRRPSTCYLYRQLRPELLSAYRTPLSSDAFSSFGRHNAAEHDDEVRAATAFLFGRATVATARVLDAVLPSDTSGSGSGSASSSSAAAADPRLVAELASTVTERLHRCGVNVRWAGLVRVHMSHGLAATLVLEEMLARVIKCEIRASLRGHVKSLRRFDEDALKQLALHQFNLVFGGSPQCWLRIRDLLRVKFECALRPAEVSRWFHLRAGVNMMRLFVAVQRKTGIQFTADSAGALRAHFELLRAAPQWSDALGGPFDHHHIKALQSTVKRMQCMPRIEGDSLYMIAELKKTEHPRDAHRHYMFAHNRYQVSLSGKPDDAAGLANWGNVLVGIARLHAKAKRAKESDLHYWKAHERFRLSTRVDPNNTVTLRSWLQALDEHIADYHLEHGAVEKTLELFRTMDPLHTRLVKLLRARSASPGSLADALGHHSLTLLKYSRFLRQSLSHVPSSLERAETLLTSARERFDDAMQIDEFNIDLKINAAVVLIEHALLRHDQYSDVMLSRAFSLLSTVEEMPGGAGKGSYNLACLYGILLKRAVAAASNSDDQTTLAGDPSKIDNYRSLCRKYLEIALETKHLPLRRQLEQDQDLSAVASEPWFKDIAKQKARSEGLLHRFF